MGSGPGTSALRPYVGADEKKSVSRQRDERADDVRSVACGSIGWSDRLLVRLPGTLVLFGQFDDTERRLVCILSRH